MILGDIVKNGITGLIDSVSNAAHKFITTEKDRQLFELELLKIKDTERDKLLQHIEQAEKNITERHKSDMMSDSWLSKNVRPIVLIYLLIAFTLFAAGSHHFSISIAYIEMLKEMLKLVFGFYFGGRSVEKIIGMIRK